MRGHGHNQGAFLDVQEARSILVVDDQPETRQAIFEALTRAGHAVALAQSREEALEAFRARPFELVIADVDSPRLPGPDLLEEVKEIRGGTPVILIPTDGSVGDAVAAMRAGAFDYLPKPLSMDLLAETVARGLSASNGSGAWKTGCPAADHPSADRPIITQDPGMKRLLTRAAQVAGSKATVLIEGESGTGKELLARYIHRASDRSDGPFVAINCASLPEGLLESELFGHEKGSFTGASMRKIGKFELAHQGTILLDEVSEMGPPLQPKLLRVLQEGEIDRVGGKHPVPIDVRVVATTNRDLLDWVEQGRFRQDLYYRLNVIPLRIPALRERAGDILPLARYFLEKYSRECGRKVKTMGPEAESRLLRLSWPGNVRELENMMARGVLLAETDTVGPADFFLEEAGCKERPDAALATEEDLRISTIREMERRLIRRALTETDGNRTHAARILGISVRTLRNKLAEYKNLGGEAGQAA